MTFVSFAQNYEDVILHRVLSDIDRGFYVDVGAQDPVDDSVTKAFYLRGWRGINVEPVSRWHARLVQDRPHDVNLRMVAARAAGTMTIHDVADSGLSTTDAALAQIHAREGRAVAQQVVEARTLDSILAEHAPTQIHFLKIDVEGAEADVLGGLSLDRFRPWILVVESLAPNSSTVETHAEWEPGVLAAGYRFVYEDGLNRFYLADEHADRAPLFARPPNFWDRFVRAPEWRAREDAEALRGQMRLIETGERIGELSNAFQRVMADMEGMQRQHASLSADLARLQQELAAARVAAREEADENARARHATQAAERAMHDAQGALQEAGRQAAALHQELKMRDMAIEFWRESHDGLLAKYNDIIASKSWRLTRPLRVFRRVLDHGPANVIAQPRGVAEPQPALPAGTVAQSASPAIAQPQAGMSPQAVAARDALDAAWQARHGQDG